MDTLDTAQPNTPVQPKSVDTDSTWGWIRDVAETVLIAVGIFLVLYFFVIQPDVVEGESMMPNYQQGEYVLSSRIAHWTGDYHRGDVIILHSPVEDKQYIKRIIGLPNETITIKDNHVVITNHDHPNGMILHESYLSSSVITDGKTFLPENTPYKIPANHYFVMGDNREYSSDSRYWGTIDRSAIIGDVALVYWPITEAGLVHRPSY